MPGAADDLARLWEWFAANQCDGYSPLYAQISRGVAADTALLDFVRGLPPSAHIPPLLLAAAHYLLLGGEDEPLAAVYDGRSGADPVPLFRDLCDRRAAEIATLMVSRTVQTNECGRSALLAPAITWTAAQLHGGAPIALVDVGTSAGVNLLLDRFRLDYGDHGATGPADASVVIPCSVTGGAPPIAGALPAFLHKVGVDLAPVDARDPDAVRWLLACVWPGTGRLERTAAALRLAAQDPPRIVTGDATVVLPEVLDALPASAVAVITTTWAFAYFSLDRRAAFVEMLAAESARRTIHWLSAEGRATVPGAWVRDTPTGAPANADILGAVHFDRGGRRDHLLAFVHPHGLWIDWRAAS